MPDNTPLTVRERLATSDHSTAHSLSRPDLNSLLNFRAGLEKASTCEVRFDAATRAVYASEASNYRQLPIAVVVPKSQDDLVVAIKFCQEAGLPILPRGAGTSMCGQSVNAAVILDASKYLNHIVHIDEAKRISRIRVFSSESVLRISWPKYWNFNISPPSKYTD